MLRQQLSWALSVDRERLVEEEEVNEGESRSQMIEKRCALRMGDQWAAIVVCARVVMGVVLVVLVVVEAGIVVVVVVDVVVVVVG